jgi:calcineurin-like phosphoesterase family protein
MRWFTSDLHFGHENIIKFCDRPFTDLHHMHTTIVNNINNLVGQDDELWILGDLAMGLLTNTLPITKRIIGKVHLVAGNHDRVHPYSGVSKSENMIPTYMELANLESLCRTNATLVLSNGLEVAVSHFPYLIEEKRSHKEDKFAKWRLKDEGDWILHGHTHGTWRMKERQIDVGIDAWGGEPVSEDTIVKLIEAGPKNLDKITWVL